MQKKLVWLLGFFLVANVYLIPMLDQTPRATDMIGAILAVGMFFYYLRHGIDPIGLFMMMLISFFPLIWLLYAFGIQDDLTVLLSIRWLLAIPWGYVIYKLMSRSEFRPVFVQGMVYGLFVNLLVLIMQFFGIVEILENIGLAAQDGRYRATYGESRMPGMHGVDNGTMAVISLITPLSLYLSYRYRKGWILLTGILILGLGSSITLSRSSVLVSITVLVFVLLFNAILKRTYRYGAIITSVLLIVLVFIGPPGGWERWTDSNNLQVNSEGRIDTNILSLNLTLTNPLGIGDQQREEIVGATHNAFLQSTLDFGLPFGMILAIPLICLALRTVRGINDKWVLEAIMALQLVGLFMWEEYLGNPTFIILTTWLVMFSSRNLIGLLAKLHTYNDKRNLYLLRDPFKEGV